MHYAICFVFYFSWSFPSTLNIRSCFDVSSSCFKPSFFALRLLHLLHKSASAQIVVIVLLSILLRSLVIFARIFFFLHAFPAPVTSTRVQSTSHRRLRFHETIHLFLINNHRSLIGGNLRQVARVILFRVFSLCKRIANEHQRI